MEMKKEYCGKSECHMLESKEHENWERIDDSIIDYYLRLPIKNFNYLQKEKIMLSYRR